MSTNYVEDLQSINHQITISQAAALIARFDASESAILAGDFQTANPFVKSQTFDLLQVQQLLQQEGCVGLRAYNGLYDTLSAPDTAHAGKMVMVLCGVDENGEDLNLQLNTTITGQVILEQAQICPPICAPTSLINNL